MPFGERLGEARPAGAALELGAAVEQRQAAQPAGEDARPLLIEEDAAERRLGAMLEQDVASLRRRGRRRASGTVPRSEESGRRWWRRRQDPGASSGPLRLRLALITWIGHRAACVERRTRHSPRTRPNMPRSSAFRRRRSAPAAEGAAGQRRRRPTQSRANSPTGLRESRSSMRPSYRIVVLLTGPSRWRTAAPAACQSSSGPAPRRPTPRRSPRMRKHLIDFRTDLPDARGAGYDQRTGEVVLLVTPRRCRALRASTRSATRAEQVSGVPVRVDRQRADRIQHERRRRRPRRRREHADQPPQRLHERLRRHRTARAMRSPPRPIARTS